MKSGPKIERLLDREGRLKRMPVRREPRAVALVYLAGKFEADERYTETQVNEILDSWHSFGDHTWLRRELCDAGYLSRLDDGSAYWLTAEMASAVAASRPNER